jgi:hypothetical protein
MSFSHNWCKTGESYNEQRMTGIQEGKRHSHPVHELPLLIVDQTMNAFRAGAVVASSMLEASKDLYTDT